MAGAKNYEDKDGGDACGTVCLKYLLFIFNFIFWLAGCGVMAVGIWTLVEKADYISLLASSTFAATAYILVIAGAVVMVTGALGCCAVVKERKAFLQAYFILLLLIFLLEIIAGVLAYIYHQQLSLELHQHLNSTMVENYQQDQQDRVTSAVDKLQQEFKCCGSKNYQDWASSRYIRSAASNDRLVPDSCCKTRTPSCGKRTHPSNIYNVEGGCITKLEKFLSDHLLIIGAVGIGVACLQVLGMIFTCCLYRKLKSDPY
ncbi:CD151 antigen-like [Lampetra fluviatilis]